MSDSYTERLYEQYRKAAQAMSDVTDKAAEEQRDLTAEENESLEKAGADLQALKTTIDAQVARVELIQKADAFREDMAPRVEAAREARKEPSDGDMLREMFKTAVAGGVAERDFDLSRSLKTRLHVQSAMESRALSGHVGTAIPTSFADFVTVYERTFTPMLNPDVVRIIPRSNGEPVVFPRLTADPSVSGTVTAEATGITEADPTLAIVTLNPYKYAVVNLWSRELADDNTIGLEELLAEASGRELAIDIGTALTTGDGSDKPNGFVTAAANGGTATGTGTTYGTYFGPTDLVSLFYGRAQPYRVNGSWQMNATSLAQARNARDTAGNHIWQPSLAAGLPETLLGRPVYENPAMANGSAAKAVAFGDFKRYIVSRVLPIRVEMSRDYKFSTDQLALKTVERVDGDLVDTIAVAYLVNAAV